MFRPRGLRCSPGWRRRWSLAVGRFFTWGVRRGRTLSGCRPCVLRVRWSPCLRWVARPALGSGRGRRFRRSLLLPLRRVCRFAGSLVAARLCRFGLVSWGVRGPLLAGVAVGFLFCRRRRRVVRWRSRRRFCRVACRSGRCVWGSLLPRFRSPFSPLPRSRWVCRSPVWGVTHDPPRTLHLYPEVSLGLAGISGSRAGVRRSPPAHRLAPQYPTPRHRRDAGSRSCVRRTPAHHVRRRSCPPSQVVQFTPASSPFSDASPHEGVLGSSLFLSFCRGRRPAGSPVHRDSNFLISAGVDAVGSPLPHQTFLEECHVTV